MWVIDFPNRENLPTDILQAQPAILLSVKCKKRRLLANRNVSGMKPRISVIQVDVNELEFLITSAVTDDEISNLRSRSREIADRNHAGGSETLMWSNALIDRSPVAINLLG